MNKKELIEEVRIFTGLTKKTSYSAVNAVFGAIKNALQEDKAVNIGDFGSFYVKKRAERNGVNPKTGEAIRLKAKNIASFKPYKDLKEIQL